MTIKKPRLDEVESRGGHPGALVVGTGNFAVNPDAQTVAGMMSGSNNFQFFAVLAYLQDAAVMRHHGFLKVAGFDEIEIALGINIEIKTVLLVMVADGDVVVKILAIIGFAIIVEIVEPRDLIATKHVNLAAYNLQPEWLKKARGVAAPC